MTSLRACAAATLAAAVAAACGSPPRSTEHLSAGSPQSAPPAWTLSPYAFGPVRIGGTLNDLNRVLGETLRPAYDVNDECDYVRPAAFPPGVSAMLLKDIVVRIDVESPAVRTAEGLGVDDAEADVVARYGGRAVVSAHKYTGPQGHYVTIADAGDPTRLTIFETDGMRVERFRAGLVPAVQFVEGCS